MSVLIDIRRAVRALLRSPGFSGIAVLTLALAVGANIAIYSALQTLVLHPLPFDDADRLVYLWHRNPEMGGTMVTPPRKAIDQWRTATHAFEAIESFTGQSLVITGGAEPEEVKISLIRPSMLTMLGVSPHLGRGLIDADSAPGAPRVALISDGLWHRRYGADRDIIGKAITLSNSAYTIVGVMPANFILPMGSDILWTAARDADADQAGQNTIAKLRPGVSQADAQRELDRLAATNTHDKDLAGWSGFVFAPTAFNGAQSTLVLLSGAVGLLLLIACVNVANLMLSRNSGRKREVAVRHALGASRGQLVRHLLAESVVLSVAGGLAGLWLAERILDVMIVLRPRNLDTLQRVHIDGTVLAFAAGLSLLTALLFGMMPALRASRVNLQDVLKAGGRGATESNHRIRQVLSTAQIAIALVLMVGAALLIRSFARLSNVDVGINPNGVVSMRISLPSDRYKDAAQRRAFFDDLLTSVSSLPGVTSAAVANGIPPEAGILLGTLEVSGRPNPANATPAIYSGGNITPAYFATLGIPVLQGRAFGAVDVATSDPVVIISHSLATKYWPGRSPLGDQLRLDSLVPFATVVGVVGDVKANGLSAADLGGMQIYFPRAQTKSGFGVVIAHTTADPFALIPALKARVWAMDARLPVRDVLTAQEFVARSTSGSRFNLALLTTFALCGLLLAAIGVYGVMALFVGQRQREMGVRMALGATPRAVARLVVEQTMTVLAMGVAIGSIGAWALTRLMRSMLFETGPTDGVSFAAAIGAIVCAALLAAAVPVRRATRVDPAVVLRGE